MELKNYQYDNKEIEMNKYKKMRPNLTDQEIN